MKKSESYLVPIVTVLLIFASAMAACSKSSGGKPKISIESITTLVQPEEPLDIKLKFTNGGQLSGGIYWVERIRINAIPPVNTLGGDTVTSPIPDFNKVQQGQLDYTQQYQGYLHFDDHINDTLIFRIVVTTTGGISSDTLTTPKIVSISP